MIHSDTSATSSTFGCSTIDDDAVYSYQGRYIKIRSTGAYFDVVIVRDSVEELLAIAALEKDRLHWTFKVVLVWMYNYMPVFLLLVLRLMISLSGWLARVGKRIKSGN